MTINLYWSLVQVFSIDNHAPTYDHPTYDNPNLRSVFPKENLYSRSTEFATKTPLKKISIQTTTKISLIFHFKPHFYISLKKLLHCHFTTEKLLN